MKLVYPVCFYPCEEDGYCVEIPDLQGCTTQGENMPHAIEMAIDAASGWILDEIESGKPVPTASHIKDIVPEEPDGIVSLIALDIDAYAEKYGDKAVRKNLTVPAWLNTQAEKANAPFSQILQEGLKTYLGITA